MNSLPRDLNQRILSGTGLQVFARLWSASCAMLALMLMDRVVSDASFGMYNYYFTLFQIAFTAIDFGGTGIAVREISRNPRRENEILRFMASFRMAAAFVSLVAINLHCHFTEDNVTARMVILLSSVHLLLLSPAAVVAHFHSRVKFAPVAASQVVGYTVFLAGAYILYTGGNDSAPSYLLAYGIGVGIQSILLYFFALGKVNILGPFRWEYGKLLFKEMLPIGISSAAAICYLYLDTLLLRYFRGDDEVGYYNHAFRVLFFVLAVPQFFCQALFPVLSRLAAADRSKVIPVVRRGSFYLAAVIFPAAAMTPSLGPAVLDLLWDEVTPQAEQALNALAVGAVAIFLAYPQISALTAIGRQATFTRISLVALGLKLALGMWLIRSFGVLGAGLAMAVTEWMVFFSVTACLRLHLGGTGLSTLLIRPVLAAIPAGLCAFFFLRGVSPTLAVPGGVALEIGSLMLAGALTFDLKVENER